MYKIYISSTYEDLKSQREVAKNVILDMGHHPIAMEHYTSVSEKPLDKCLKDIRECDLFVGIYGFRYGYIPDGFSESITHLEYNEAVKWGKTLLLFVYSEEVPFPAKDIDDDRTNILAFRESLMKDYVIEVLDPDEDFGTKLSASIHKATPAPEQRPAPKIPPILPYLSNRSKQETELEFALDDYEEVFNEKPLVCFIHGDEIECHDKFIKRLHEIILPKLLIGAGDVPVNSTRVEWPTIDDKLKIRTKKLTNDIARALCGNRRASKAELKNELDGRNEAQMIHFMLPVSDWQKNEPDLFDNWLNYWNDFPDLIEGKKLMIFFCVKYKNLFDISDDEAKKFKKLNSQARKFIENTDFKNYPNITGLKMSELKSVEYGDVDKWIVKHTPESCDDTELRNRIMKFFNERQNQAVPMLELAGKLNELLLITQTNKE